MISEATVSAIRFGYGPGGRDVPRDAAGHLARLRRGDRMVRRYPTPDLAAAMAAGQASLGKTNWRTEPNCAPRAGS